MWIEHAIFRAKVQMLNFDLGLLIFHGCVCRSLLAICLYYHLSGLTHYLVFKLSAILAD